MRGLVKMIKIKCGKCGKKNKFSKRQETALYYDVIVCKCGNKIFC